MSSFCNRRRRLLHTCCRPCVLWAPLLVLAALLLVGCGSDNPRNRQPVWGDVTFNGAPLERGVIEFHAQQERSVASGSLIRNGKYSLPEEKGLPEGSYLVRIYSGKENPPNMRGSDGGELSAPGAELPGIELIPSKYNAFSEIVREIVAGKNNQFDFQITTSGD